MKLLLFMLFFLLFPIQIYSQIYINEINFIDDEYLEIYSNQTLNLTNNKIFDENSDSNFNILSLNKLVNNSNYYLIIGSNFAQNNDLSKFNCSIYESDKSQVSSGGLKSSGENLTLQIDNSTNLSYTNLIDYFFNFNETLNYNSTTNSFFKGTQTPCNSNLFLQKNNSNLSNSTDENTLNSCNYSFEIITDKDIFEDKIQYEFETNMSIFQIEYWIEKYNGEIVKDKRTTTNTNQKSYTPDDNTEIYNIKGILNNDNCSIEKTKPVSFYFNSKDSKVEEEDRSQELKSSIQITNEKDLINLKTDELRYEIYRGDTSKRTTYFYLNSNVIHSNEINKYSKSKGKIQLNLLSGENNLIIKGLDIEKNIVIFNKQNSQKEIQNTQESSSKQYFKILNLEVKSQDISFQIDSNLENLTGECYINLVKTQVSNTQNVSNKIKKINLEINNSLLTSKSEEKINTLKLTCKYKKSHLKTFNYESKEFNYSIGPTEDKLNIKELSKDYYNQEEVFQNYSYSDTNYLSSLEKEDLYENNLIKNDSSYFDNYTFESKNTKSKMNSIYFVFLGTIFLLTAMLIKW